MEKVEKHTFIGAPPAAVFAWLADPAHLPEIWPSMVEVTNVRRSPDGAHSFDWTYRMAGVRLHGHAETIALEPDRLRVVRNSGLPSTFRWTYAPHGDGTELGLEVEYELPGPFGALAAPVLRRINEREAELLVRNLKERMETAQELP